MTEENQNDLISSHSIGGIHRLNYLEKNIFLINVTTKDIYKKENNL